MSAPVRRRRPEARPSEIIAAALEEFTAKGFAATRLDDVAQRAGLSKGAIYLYFTDKRALLRGVVEEMATTNVAAFRAQVERHEGAAAPLLQAVLLALAQRIAGSPLPHLIKLIIAESRGQPEIGRLYLETVIQRAVPVIRELIERGIAAGEFRPVDADLTVRCVVGPMLLAALWRSVFEPIGGEPLDVEALARQHADILIRGLAAGAVPNEPGRPS